MAKQTKMKSKSLSTIRYTYSDMTKWVSIEKYFPYSYFLG